MKVYLDACCLNRLTDDQRQPRIAEEARAVEQVLRLIGMKKVDWLSSPALNAEVERNPDEEGRHQAKILLRLATETIALDARIITRAKELEALGYGAFDGLHLSAAEASGAGVLLTTDDRFIRKAARGVGTPRVSVLNPLEWLRSQRI